MAVRTRGKLLVIDFRCYLPGGRRVRCVETTGLEETEKNLKRTLAKWNAIKYELDQGTFEYLRFFPYGSKAKYFRSASQGLLYSEFYEQWLSEKSMSYGTERNYTYYYDHHVEPHFGHMIMTDIDETEILIFRKRLEGKNLAAATVNNVIQLLCSTLKKAHRRGLIPVYPCADISRLRQGVPEVDPFSFAELRTWLSYLSENNPAWYDLVLIWSRTGLRPGELYGLKWDHVDYFNRKMLIRDNRLTSGKDGPLKTPQSRRDVDVRPAIEAALKRQEARTRLQGTYVFMNHLNRPWSATNMQRKFRHYLGLARIRPRPPQQMRHTFATLHIAAGENISWVSRMLGHADVNTTLRRYNRFIPNLTRDDGAAYEEIMNGNGNNLVTRPHNSLK